METLTKTTPKFAVKPFKEGARLGYVATGMDENGQSFKFVGFTAEEAQDKALKFLLKKK